MLNSGKTIWGWFPTMTGRTIDIAAIPGSMRGELDVGHDGTQGGSSSRISSRTERGRRALCRRPTSKRENA